MGKFSPKESMTVEFKASFNDDVIETLTAFANTKGGKVLVGVSDNGAPVKGFTIGKESIQQWLNEVKTKTQPSIIPNIDVVEYKNSTVIEFSVHEFPVKPIAFRGRYFKRVENSNHPLSVSEISDVYLQSMQYSWDSYPYPGATINDVNLEKVRVFIANVNSKGRFQLPIEPVPAMTKLNLIKNETPTNAAMILFSKKNLLYNVHIGRFKTPSIIIADKMINGNLYDVVEESMQTIVGHLKFAFEITGQTTRRTEIPEYPLDALRELLLNALIHRDYKSSTDVQIKIFDQKITFFNPGGLYGNITEADLLTDVYQASTRNKQLAEAFYLTRDIEKYGSGFIHIRNAIANYPTMKFEFRELGDGFITEFNYIKQKITTEGDEIIPNVPKNVPEKEVNVTENVPKKGVNVTRSVPQNNYDFQENRFPIILTMVKKDKTVSMQCMANFFDVNIKTIKRDLERLKTMGLLERIGAKKGGYWVVK